jgi:hypothetical protein
MYFYDLYPYQILYALAIIANKPEAKYIFHAAAILLFHIL